jgi:hypothetical protein
LPTEQLGDQVTSEPVGWFNTMDTAQKGELREINERNAQRFEARLDQRSAELRAELGAKIDHVAIDLNAKIDRVAAELREFLERRLGEQARWSCLTWAVQAALILGLYFK